MKLIALIPWVVCAIANVIRAAPSSNISEVAARRQIKQWQNGYNRYIKDTIKTRTSGCTPESIVYRQEWGTLPKKTRTEYIAAVQCLISKPPIYPRSEVPGGRSHFDDFAATHISLTPFIHFDGIFFQWHRYFVWLYEQALRNECGYNGTQPYWDWTIDYEDPTKSPVFDGSPYSMGSNGRPEPHGIVTISAFGLHVPINPGGGGGCVYKGPFKNHTLNLGPFASPPLDSDGGLGYNPRCLARDLHPEWTNHTKPSDIVNLFRQCTDLECFDTNAEGPVGFHTSGHFAVGGIMMDTFASPQDPMFFLHHAQVDRMWSLWQGLNPKNRTYQVYGTQTAFNNPPSPNVTLETELDFLRLAQKQRLKDVVSTVDGPFCYTYI